jgi:hypothetical protein
MDYETAGDTNKGILTPSRITVINFVSENR